MGGGVVPCGACKFLRRKCVKGCVFAPYFCSEEMEASHFGAIHKVFGASNFSKLLMHLPVQQRYDAVLSVLYEAEARLQDPVYGCVSHIYALQQQVAYLKEKLSVAYAQVAACRTSNGASLNPEYGYDKQMKMPSLISTSNRISHHDKQYVNSWEDLQQVSFCNVGMKNYNAKAREDEGSWRSFSECMQGDNSMSVIHALSTAQEKDIVQDSERLSEQRHPQNNGQDGDLQDLALALLRRNRSTCITTEFFE